MVEDSTLVTSATRILLEDAGFRVSTAATLSEAHRIAESDPPAAILLDAFLQDRQPTLPQTGTYTLLVYAVDDAGRGH